MRYIYMRYMKFINEEKGSSARQYFKGFMRIIQAMVAL